MPKSKDGKVGDVIRHRSLGHHLLRPYTRDRWLLLDAEIVTVQFDRDRPSTTDYVRGSQNQRLAFHRSNNCPTSLRASPTDQDGGPKSPVVRRHDRIERTCPGSRRGSGRSLRRICGRWLAFLSRLVTQAKLFKNAKKEHKSERKQARPLAFSRLDPTALLMIDREPLPAPFSRPGKNRMCRRISCRRIRVSSPGARSSRFAAAYARSYVSCGTLERSEFNDLEARGTTRLLPRICRTRMMIKRNFEPEKDCLAVPTAK